MNLSVGCGRFPRKQRSKQSLRKESGWQVEQPVTARPSPEEAHGLGFRYSTHHSGAGLLALPGYKPTHSRLLDLITGVDKLTVDYTWETIWFACIYSFIHPSIQPSIHLSTHSSISRSIYPSIHSFIHLNIQADSTPMKIFSTPTVCPTLCYMLVIREECTVLSFRNIHLTPGKNHKQIVPLRNPL